MLNFFARSGVAVLLSWAAIAPQVHADDAARQRLIDLLQSTETLQAEFRQETYADGELRGDQAEGIMKIADATQNPGWLHRPVAYSGAGAAPAPGH